jgi:hypothetical protein
MGWTGLQEPARRTSRASGATSNRMRSLALVDGEVTLVNTPFSFTMIWNTSGTCRPGAARLGRQAPARAERAHATSTCRSTETG